MAGPVLKFNRKTTDLSLLSTSTFALDAKRGGYIPGVAPALADGEPAPIIETIPTFSQVASDDAMATQEQALAAMAFYANRYMTDPAVLDTMIAQGWIMEGEAATRVFACVPLQE